MGFYHFKKFNFLNQNKLELYRFQTVGNLTLICVCASHPPLKYSIQLLKEKMHWNHFETNLDMLGNQICRLLLGMQLKYHWWERMALAMVTGNILFLSGNRF